MPFVSGKLIGAVGIVGLITLGTLALWLKVVTVQRNAARAQLAIERVEQAKRQLVIDTLNHRLNALTEQQQLNGAEQASLRAMASEAKQRVEDLQRENDELRRWASGLLPERLARLYQHGPLTGAAGYRHYLRDTRAVHAPGRQTKGQRRSTP